MTELEWNAAENPQPLLIYLRGPVREEEQSIHSLHGHHGVLYDGAGKHISPDQCRRFIFQCMRRLFTLPIDEPSRAVIEAYRRFALEGAAWKEYRNACEALDQVRSAGGTTTLDTFALQWVDNPLGAGLASWHIATDIAHIKAQDSVAITCADASEDDLFAFGFCGVPDPLWQATLAAEYKFQAEALRYLVSYPPAYNPT